MRKVTMSSNVSSQPVVEDGVPNARLDDAGGADQAHSTNPEKGAPCGGSASSSGVQPSTNQLGCDVHDSGVGDIGEVEGNGVVDVASEKNALFFPDDEEENETLMEEIRNGISRRNGIVTIDDMLTSPDDPTVVIGLPEFTGSDIEQWRIQEEERFRRAVQRCRTYGRNYAIPAAPRHEYQFNCCYMEAPSTDDEKDDGKQPKERDGAGGPIQTFIGKRYRRKLQDEIAHNIAHIKYQMKRPPYVPLSERRRKQ